jgi:hypothetical protein
MSPINQSGTFALGDRIVKRIGYQCCAQCSSQSERSELGWW